MQKIVIYSLGNAELSAVAKEIRAMQIAAGAIDARYFSGDTEATKRVAYMHTNDPADEDRCEAIKTAYAAKGIEVEEIDAGDPAAITADLFPDEAEAAAPEPPPNTEAKKTAKQKRAEAKAAKLAALEAKLAAESPAGGSDAGDETNNDSE